MFSGFMVNVWIIATMVAVTAGVVGFFVVLRGSAFVAHAIPQTGFAGAAAANLIARGREPPSGAILFGKRVPGHRMPLPQRPARRPSISDRTVPAELVGSVPPRIRA